MIDEKELELCHGAAQFLWDSHNCYMKLTFRRDCWCEVGFNIDEKDLKRFQKFVSEMKIEG